MPTLPDEPVRLDTRAFAAVLRVMLRSEEWKTRACAGYLCRTFAGGLGPDAIERGRQHGLERACNESEREAWLYGFEWIEKSSERRA